MTKNGVEPVLYMTEWFMCCFIRNLPWQTVLRIFDIFLAEGVKVKNVCYGIWKLAKKKVNLILGIISGQFDSDST